MAAADWLFVGQIAPHKAQHDVVKAFACYRRVYDTSARLHLVGREMGSTYIDALRRFAVALGLEDAISLPGSVSARCARRALRVRGRVRMPSGPRRLLRADHRGDVRGVPVVAYDAAAVPETLGEAGALLPDKSTRLRRVGRARAPRRRRLHADTSSPPDVGAPRATHRRVASAAFCRAIESALAVP